MQEGILCVRMSVSVRVCVCVGKSSRASAAMHQHQGQFILQVADTHREMARFLLYTCNSCYVAIFKTSLGYPKIKLDNKN